MTTNPIKFAQPDHAILDIISRRWSPYALDPRPVAAEQVRQCLEAARWAASSYNEQPWIFILAMREDEDQFNRMLECLMDANQAWAKNAGVLMLTAVRKTFSRNGKPNRVAEHDLGLAAANLTLQATALGLHVHQMAGILPAKVRQQYNVPEGYEPTTAIAVGHAADPDRFAEKSLADRDREPRSRKRLAEFVFAGAWGRASPVVE